MAHDPEKDRAIATLRRGIRELDRLERDYLRWVKQGVPLPEHIHEFFRPATRCGSTRQECKLNSSKLPGRRTP